MALIKCNECSNEVSTDAKTCPKCGTKVKKPTSVGTMIIGGLLGTALLSAIVGSNTPHDNRGDRSDNDIQAVGSALLAERDKNVASRARAKCTDGAEELALSATAAMKAKRPSDAEFTLRPCMQFGDTPAKLKKLHADAEKAFAAAEKKRRRSEGVSIGMTPDDVLASSWGKPQKINRTQTVRRTHEQWVYGNGNYLYFDDGVLSSIQN